MSINLSQADADALIAMKKRRADDQYYEFPGPGGKVAIPLISIDRREDFLMDITRSHINLAKVTYQNRARQIVVLLRLDINGAPHRNPDGVEIACPHMHIYREDYGDKWAYPIQTGKFENLRSLNKTLEDFLAECNVIEGPNIQAVIF